MSALPHLALERLGLALGLLALRLLVLALAHALACLAATPNEW